MTPLPSSQLAALKKLCAEATPGPWLTNMSSDGLRVNQKIGEGPHPQLGEAICKWSGDSPGREKNLAFIAAARSALPALIEYCEQLTAALEKISAIGPAGEPEGVKKGQDFDTWDDGFCEAWRRAGDIARAALSSKGDAT